MDSLQLKAGAVEDVALLGLSLAEALEARGEEGSAEAVLSLLPDRRTDPEVGLSLARMAIRRGDAKGALDALVPLWSCPEAMGAIEDTLATVALALGMDETVESILEDTGASTSTQRWIQALWALSRRTLPTAPFTTPTAESRWSLRQLMTTLARLGRADLVDACAVFLEGCREAGWADMLQGIERAPAPSRALFGQDPAECRARFEAAWRGPGEGRLAFNWAWTVAQEIGAGERVLILGPGASAIKTLLPHCVITCVDRVAGEGVELIAEPEALEVPLCRFDHVIAYGWLSQALAPMEALQALANATCHEGQIHLMCPGPRCEDAVGLGLPGGHLRRMAERLDLCLDGLAPRDAEGLPTSDEDAAWSMVRLTRWLWI